MKNPGSRTLHEGISWSQKNCMPVTLIIITSIKRGVLCLCLYLVVSLLFVGLVLGLNTVRPDVRVPECNCARKDRCVIQIRKFSW